MTEDTTLSDAQWQYEVDSVQRGGTTAATQARRHGEVHTPEPTDGEAPNDQHNEDRGGFDADGIPTGI